MKIDVHLKIALFVLIAATMSLTGVADTFFLNGEVAVHGTLLRSDDKFHYIDIGGRQKRIPKKSIKHIEKNDKTGALDLEAARKRVERKQQQLTEETGLTHEERIEIERLIFTLRADNAAEANQAKRTLTGMCAAEKVYRYIAGLVEDVNFDPFLTRVLLVVLTDADAALTIPLLQTFATYVDEGVRAECLELLGIHRHVSSLTLMMRGMLDHQPVVRLAGASALAAIGAKEATPLLLKNFNHPDLRVENYTREALGIIWKAELGDTEPFKTLEEWQNFWNEQSPAVLKTVDIEGLEPLVEPGVSYSQC